LAGAVGLSGCRALLVVGRCRDYADNAACSHRLATVLCYSVRSWWCLPSLKTVQLGEGLAHQQGKGNSTHQLSQPHSLLVCCLLWQSPPATTVLLAPLSQLTLWRWPLPERYLNTCWLWGVVGLLLRAAPRPWQGGPLRGHGWQGPGRTAPRPWQGGPLRGPLLLSSQ